MIISLYIIATHFNRSLQTTSGSPITFWAVVLFELMNVIIIIAFTSFGATRNFLVLGSNVLVEVATVQGVN